MTTVNPRNLGFYAVQPDIIRDSARKLLREYSHVPEDGIDAHVEAIVGYLAFCFDMNWTDRVIQRQRAFKIVCRWLASKYAVAVADFHSGHIHALECFVS